MAHWLPLDDAADLALRLHLYPIAADIADSLHYPGVTWYLREGHPVGARQLMSYNIRNRQRTGRPVTAQVTEMFRVTSGLADGRFVLAGRALHSLGCDDLVVLASLAGGDADMVLVLLELQAKSVPDAVLPVVRSLMAGPPPMSWDMAVESVGLLRIDA